MFDNSHRISDLPEVDNNECQTNINHLWVITYEDDGPYRVCGQDCYTTSCWRKVYLFKSEKTMRQFIQNITINNNNRLNPRITAIYTPEPFGIGEVNFIPN